MAFFTLTQVRELLATHGLAARRRFGQNFLIDRNVRDKIVDLAGVSRSDIVVEIGPGLGALTESLLERAAAVYAFEIDPSLCRILRERFGGAAGFHLFEQDFLATGRRWWERLPRPAVVVANTPYHLSTAIVSHLLTVRHRVARALLTVQREVGERLVARPGSPSYGILSVLLALYADARICYALSRQVFYPTPEVTSVVVRIEPRRAPLVPPESEEAFREFLPLVFHCRRKMLANVAVHTFGVEKQVFAAALGEMGISPSARIGELSPEQIWGIFSRAGVTRCRRRSGRRARASQPQGV